MNENRKATIYDFSRMCNKMRDNCEECPLSVDNNKSPYYCVDFFLKNPKEANEIILKWCDEHPQKTYMQDFLEKYPNAEIANDRPAVCRKQIDKCCQCYGKTCKECWNEVIE